MGYWKATGKDRPIRGEQTEGGKLQVIGYRKSYTYHRSVWLQGVTADGDKKL